MKKVENLNNYDEIVKSVATAMFNHDAECCRVNEDLWIRVKEDGTGEVVLEGNYNFHSDDTEYIFVKTLFGTEDDQVEEYVKYSDSPVADLADILGMDYDELMAKATEAAGIDPDDADYHTAVDYVRETPELFDKVKAAYIDWLEGAVDYEEKATLCLDQVDEDMEYENWDR